MHGRTSAEVECTRSASLITPSKYIMHFTCAKVDVSASSSLAWRALHGRVCGEVISDHIG